MYIRIISVILLGLLIFSSPSDAKTTNVTCENIIHSCISHEYPSQRQLLIRDVIAERELFVDAKAFRHFGIDERSILISINRNLGSRENHMVGLLLLSPTGMVETFVIDTNTKSVVEKRFSVLRKSLREELSVGRLSISEAQVIAELAIAKAEEILLLGRVERRRGGDR